MEVKKTNIKNKKIQRKCERTESNSKKNKLRLNNIVIKTIIIIILLILLYILIFYIVKYIKGKRVCLCAVGKKENLYAKEFINHYKKLGYNHIYIYDNNEINGERFEDVLQDEIKSNFVSIINYRGIRNIQCRAYKDCYEKNNKNYDWLSFFDFDEFLDIKAKNIQEFLNNKRYEKCQNVKINFLFYSDNELLYYDKRPLQERFTHALYGHGNNYFIKSTVRGGLKTNYWSVKCCIHTSQMPIYACNSAGQKISHGVMGYRPIYKYAKLKHYYTKSTEEYLIKSSRGSASANVGWNLRRKKFKFGLYFVYNKKTKEKVELLKKLFNMTL